MSGESEPLLASPTRLVGWAGATVLLLGGFGLFTLDASVESLPTPLFAVLLGVALGSVTRNRALTIGATVASRWFLRGGIILVALRLSIAQLQELGLATLSLIVPALLVGFGVAFLLARSRGLNPRLSLLLAAGTAICGNSAIMAAGPVLGADEDEMATSITAVTVYGTLALLAFPAVGMLVGMDQMTFGRWAGTAINDTSQVIGAGFAFGDAAGETATVVKLTRNLFILPLIVGLSILGAHWRRIPKAGTRLARLRHAIPGFVLGFVGVALINSLITIPESFREIGTDASKVLILSALIAIGVGASRVSIGPSRVVALVTGMLAGVVLALVSFGLLLLGLG